MNIAGLERKDIWQLFSKSNRMNEIQVENSKQREIFLVT